MVNILGKNQEEQMNCHQDNWKTTQKILVCKEIYCFLQEPDNYDKQTQTTDVWRIFTKEEIV